MTYEVKLDPNVNRFLDKQDKQVEERIRKRLRVLECDNPFHYLEHYEGGDCYKFRAGDYRALVDVNQSRKIVFIRVLGHRKNIYKNAP